MSEGKDEFRVEAVTTNGISPAVPIFTFLIGILLGAAVVKPWDLVFPPAQAPVGHASPTTAGASAPLAATSPTTSPAAPPVPAECIFAGGWRVFALAQPDRLGGDVSTARPEPSGSPARFADIGNPLRRWLEVEPLHDASGPEDARIPFVTIVSNRIGGIGYCPPPDGSDGPPAGAGFESWQLDETGTANAWPLRPVTLGPDSTIEVPVYIGAEPPEARNERWPPGRYVFAVDRGDPGAYSRWFGVEIRTPPGRPNG
jgi:hypothetical protein